MIRPKPRRVDEYTFESKYRIIGYLGAYASSFTLAWLATHRDRLSTLIVGGKRFSLLLIYDKKGSALVDHPDYEVDAIKTIVTGRNRKD